MAVISKLVIGLLVAVTLSSSAVNAERTLPKANEYKSTDCSGDMHIKNHSHELVRVMLSDETHSVYLAKPSGDWVAYSNAKGKMCAGAKLGKLPGECVNVDDFFDVRIRCVHRE